MGYTVETDWRPNRVELCAAGRGRVDLHHLLVDQDGSARQAALDGGFHVFRSRSLSPARWPALRFRASPPTRSVGSAAAMSYEVSISTTWLSSTSWTGAARPIPVAISWTEAAWLLPAGDSLVMARFRRASVALAS